MEKENSSDETLTENIGPSTVVEAWEIHNEGIIDALAEIFSEPEFNTEK